MNERLRWWVLPGAILVLLRVVTLDGPEVPQAPVAAAEACAGLGSVAVLEASGQRTGPVALGSTATGAFVLRVPAAFGGRCADMTLWRRLDGRRETSPWLTLRPRVRDDATLPITGLRAGRYDVELRFDTAVLRADDVAAPGAVALTPLAPQPPR